MALLPGLDLGMLVRGIVVANDVDILVCGHCFADQVEKTNPLLMTLLLHAAADAAAVCDVARGEQ